MVYYGCEFSVSLDAALKEIVEPVKAPHECVLEFNDRPTEATRKVLRRCGFRRMSKRDAQEFLN